MVLFYVALAGLLSFAATPAAAGLAWRIGAVDVPRDWRRMHARRIPRAGGLAIFAAFLISCLAAGETTRLLAVSFGGGFLLLLVGLADDIFSLGAGVKLFFQLAVTIATVTGSKIAEGAGLVPAILWVLLLANAHNFIDGLDGLFAGTALIEGGLLALALLTRGAGEYAVAPLLLSAACMGFWIHNRHPASIFAGDCGSVTVGFLLAMLSLPLLVGESDPFFLMSPPFLFAYPLTDLFLSVLRRLLRGRSIFAADRAHLHHRLIDVGLSQPQCVLILHSIAASLGGIGVLLTDRALFVPASFFCVAVALLLIRIRHFISNFA